MKTKPKPETLVHKIERCIRARELGAKNYKRSDALLDELMKELEPGQVLPLNANGRKIEIIDNYPPGKVVHFKPCGVRRYELKVIEA